ncbi:MAG: hypothetical protein HYT98_03700 [Candidatus Sungbacteria bacterium]|nr:hypothetical protein [Candidatus Sungbacteria bacterium]
MDIQKAIQLIEHGNHIAFILPPGPSFDCLASAEILAHALTARGKRVGFVMSHNSSSALSAETFPIVSSATPLLREFIVSLNTDGSPVAELRYEKRDNGIDVIFAPKSAPISENLISFQNGKPLCHAAITFGISRIDEIEHNSALTPDFFTETPLITINISKDDHTNYGEANLIDPGRASLSEIAYLFVSSLSESPLDAEHATLALAGILSATNELRSVAAGADTLLSASELLRLGADRIRAQHLLSGPKTHDLNPLLGRALVRSRQDESGVFWSILTGEDFEKSGKSSRDITPLMPSLEKNSDPSKIISLLWQNPSTQKIHATLAGPREKLEAIKESSAGEFQSPYLALSTTFSSFRDAETYISGIIHRVSA